MVFTSKCIYMGHHFYLLRLNPFELSIDREGSWFDHSVYSCWFACQQRVLKTFPGPDYVRFEDAAV